MSDFFICPNCGAEVKRGAKSCTECGSDDKTGWSEFTYMDGLGLPDDDEYNELKDNEFAKDVKKNNIWIVITAAVLLVGICLMVMKGMF